MAVRGDLEGVKKEAIFTVFDPFLPPNRHPFRGQIAYLGDADFEVYTWRTLEFGARRPCMGGKWPSEVKIPTVAAIWTMRFLTILL